MTVSNTLHTQDLTRTTHIRCGISHAFYNKQNRDGRKSAFGQSFIPKEITLSEFTQHVTSGYAWTQGYFKSNRRRKDAFVSAQTLALDLDDKISVADALDEKLIRDHALLVHPSPSSTAEHPKTRVVFVLDEAITNVNEWERLQRGVIAYFAHLRPDPACKDAARLFYGSTQKGVHVNLQARLPIDKLLTLIPEPDTPPVPPAKPPSTKHPQQPNLATAKFREHTATLSTSGSGLSGELVRDVEQALGVANVPTNSAGFAIRPCACPVKHHEHDQTNPAAYWHPGIHALKCFKCGETYNTHEVAAALNIDIHSYYQHTKQWDYLRDNNKKDNNLHEEGAGLYPFTADMHVNLRYISMLDAHAFTNTRATLVKSPIGTGKTQAATNVIQALAGTLGRPPRILALTHRQALADDLTRRLSGDESGYQFECYKGLEAIDLRRISRLVICYDSVWKLATVGEALPEYDLIIIDEIEQFHQHLGGETMRGSEPERAYIVLRQLVKQTAHFLGMDAHCTDISRNWLASLLDGQEHVTCIHNSYRMEKGMLNLHKSKETAVARALHLATAGQGTVVIPTNSRAMAKRLACVFEEEIGKDDVLVIHGGNSNDSDIQDFIRDINNEIEKYRVVIYSPSLGTGVDITTTVRAVIGIFSTQPLCPADMHQMMGRCRNAQERHVWVQNMEGNFETDWRYIYTRHEQNALQTGLLCSFDEKGILTTTPIQKAMLKLLSQLAAIRNNTMNAPLHSFCALAKAEGYTLSFTEGRNKAVREQVDDATERVKEAERAAVLAADPITHEEMEQHRQAGTNTPEVEAGYERFKIETCVGATITPQIYADMHTPQQRATLRRFTDLNDDETYLQHYDQQEAIIKTLISKRSHHILTRLLITKAIYTVWGDLAKEGDNIHDLLKRGTETEIAGEVILERMETYFREEKRRLQTYMGWRCDLSDNPIAVLRWLLKRIGLSLNSRQVMIMGERHRVYYIGEEALSTMRGYADTRLAHLEKQRPAQITQNTDIYTISSGNE